MKFEIKLTSGDFYELEQYDDYLYWLSCCFKGLVTMMNMATLSAKEMALGLQGALNQLHAPTERAKDKLYEYEIYWTKEDLKEGCRHVYEARDRQFIEEHNMRYTK